MEQRYWVSKQLTLLAAVGDDSGVTQKRSFFPSLYMDHQAGTREYFPNLSKVCVPQSHLRRGEILSHSIYLPNIHLGSQSNHAPNEKDATKLWAKKTGFCPIRLDAITNSMQPLMHQRATDDKIDALFREAGRLVKGGSGSLISRCLGKLSRK